MTMTDLNSLMISPKWSRRTGFSEAARRLKMPTSTVSRRVADLEDQLGVRLLERSTRSLRLTDVGSEVLEHAQHTTELSEAVDNIASNHLSNVSGVLRLGRATQHLRLVACAAGRRIPSLLPQRTSTGFHYRPDRGSDRRGALTWCSRSENNSKIRRSSARRILTYRISS